MKLGEYFKKVHQGDARVVMVTGAEKALLEEGSKKVNEALALDNVEQRNRAEKVWIELKDKKFDQACSR